MMSSHFYVLHHINNKLIDNKIFKIEELNYLFNNYFDN